MRLVRPPTRAQDRVKQQRADLRKIEADTNTPLPTQIEGQLNVARAEWLAAERCSKR